MCRSPDIEHSTFPQSVHSYVVTTRKKQKKPNTDRAAAPSGYPHHLLVTMLTTIHLLSNTYISVVCV
jgi:hypothetical protein